ncbi:MAG: Ig-like domain-containing protein, partial [Anaerolineales bacterium]|nr:Ig-like domain-containing protein [Anaerolineales bacterium]
PSDGAAEVETDGAITVLFNRPVVPLVSSGQQADLPQPISLNPTVSGSGEWVSTSIYRFTPDTGFDGATTYRVTIAAGLTDIAGAALEDDFSWSFTTRSPQIVSIDPVDGSTGIDPTRALTITFNMPMDRASTETAVLVPGVGVGNAAVSATWSDGDRVLTLTPQQRLELETEYQIVVGGTAAAANGQVTLGVDEVSTFATVPYPAVLYTYPEANALADRYQYGVSIGFASPMDMDTLDGRISIDPTPDRVDTYWADYSNELSLNFVLQRNTTYRLTIPADAADPYGNTLGKEYTWQFTTPDYDPIASFNLPQGISQLSTSFVTQVDIIHRNVSELNVALYDVGLPLNLLLNSYDLYDYQPNSQPRQSWDIPLSEENGLTTLSLAGEGTLPTGVYFLSLNAPELLIQETRYWQNQRHLLIVADTNIVVKEMFDEVHVWATDIASGQPAAGRNLVLYNERGVQIGTAVSDNDGFATFGRPQRADYLGNLLVTSNQPGQVGFGVASSNWSASVSPWELGLDNVGYGAPAPAFSYLYTDRPIYRPGDTVYFKGIVRDSDYGRYYLPTLTDVSISLQPNFYSEGESFSETFNFTLSADGSFSGEYTLPENLPLGSYLLSIGGQTYETFRPFTVAEYRKPEFLVNLTPERAEALRGEAVDVTLEATYFFGGSASDLSVSWSVWEDTYYPDVPGPYYSFGDDSNFFYEDPFLVGGGTDGRYLIGGEGKTDANGRFTLTLPANLLADINAGSRKITVIADVLDISNFPINSRTQITFHDANTYVGVKPAEYVTRAGTETAVDLLTVDWDGQPVANQDVEVVFYEREWNSRRINDYGFYRTQWEPVDTEISRAQVRTDGQGKANASFTPQNGGSYIAIATVTDSSGHSQSSSAYLWVTDLDFIGWRSAERERSMSIVPDKQEYQPGDTAQILVQSPFTVPVQAWVTIERGRLIEQRLVTLQSNSDVLEIPIPPDYAPNVYVSVVAIKPVTPSDEANPYADVRLGVTELVVSPEQLLLTVELIPQQESFVPGETAVYDIR